MSLQHKSLSDDYRNYNEHERTVALDVGIDIFRACKGLNNREQPMQYYDENGRVEELPHRPKAFLDVMEKEWHSVLRDITKCLDQQGNGATKDTAPSVFVTAVGHNRIDIAENVLKQYPQILENINTTNEAARAACDKYNTFFTPGTTVTEAITKYVEAHHENKGPAPSRDGLNYLFEKSLYREHNKSTALSQSCENADVDLYKHIAQQTKNSAQFEHADEQLIKCLIGATKIKHSFNSDEQSQERERLIKNSTEIFNDLFDRGVDPVKSLHNFKEITESNKCYNYSRTGAVRGVFDQFFDVAISRATPNLREDISSSQILTAFLMNTTFDGDQRTSTTMFSHLNLLLDKSDLVEVDKNIKDKQPSLNALNALIFKNWGPNNDDISNAIGKMISKGLSTEALEKTIHSLEQFSNHKNHVEVLKGSLTKAKMIQEIKDINKPVVMGNPMRNGVGIKVTHEESRERGQRRM